MSEGSNAIYDEGQWGQREEAVKQPRESAIGAAAVTSSQHNFCQRVPSSAVYSYVITFFTFLSCLAELQL